MKMPIDKEWFERRAKAEAELEIGAGFSVVNMTDADVAQMEVLAERALPQWAQDELLCLRTGIKRLSDEEELCAETTGDDPYSMVYLAAKLAAAEGTINKLSGIDVDKIAKAIVLAACELDELPDPDDDDTLTITIHDLEAVAHRHITVAIDRAAVAAAEGP